MLRPALRSPARSAPPGGWSARRRGAGWPRVHACRRARYQAGLAAMVRGRGSGLAGVRVRGDTARTRQRRCAARARDRVWAYSAVVTRRLQFGAGAAERAWTGMRSLERTCDVRNLHAGFQADGGGVSKGLLGKENSFWTVLDPQNKTVGGECGSNQPYPARIFRDPEPCTLVFHIFGALAQIERDQMSSRCENPKMHKVASHSSRNERVRPSFNESPSRSRCPLHSLTRSNPRDAPRAAS